MKCTRCGQKAAIAMRQHNLALCKDDFLAWVPQQTERFIEKYHMFTRADRVLVAVSGGKDSLALWDVLWRLGYPADGLYIDLGIDGGIGYSAESRRLAEAFAAERGLTLRVVSVAQESGQAIPQLAQASIRGKSKPCAVCGTAKRHIMNRAARDLGYPVLATGHNLDDEAAVLFANTLEWKLDPLARQSPVLEAAQGLARKVKPFCRFYERETAAYALLRGIRYIYEECPFAEGSQSIAIKGFLNQLEQARPGAKLTFYLSFLRARESGAFSPPPAEAVSMLRPCALCGQPTASSDGVCAYCRMTHRAAAPSTGAGTQEPAQPAAGRADPLPD